MGEENNRKIDYYVIYAALVFALGVASYWWMFHEAGYSSGRYEERANIEREHYAADAAERLGKSCGSLAGAAFRKCAYGVVNSERESKREESDLAAQWQAADWVRWASIVAGAQLIATIIGLIFIKRTLDATWKAVEDTGEATDAMREANEIAENTAKRQLRAYVGIENIELAGVAVGQRPGATIISKNFGQTPADQFTVISYMVFAPIDHEDDLMVPAEVGDSRKNLPPAAVSRAYPSLGRKWTEADASHLSKGLANIYIYGEIRYVDAFDSGHTTSFRMKHNKRCRSGLTHFCEDGNWAD